MAPQCRVGGVQQSRPFCIQVGSKITRFQGFLGGLQRATKAQHPLKKGSKRLNLEQLILDLCALGPCCAHCGPGGLRALPRARCVAACLQMLPLRTVSMVLLGGTGTLLGHGGGGGGAHPDQCPAASDAVDLLQCGGAQKFFFLLKTAMAPSNKNSTFHGFRGSSWLSKHCPPPPLLKADWDAPRGLDWCPSVVVMPGMICFARGSCDVVDSGAARVLCQVGWQGLTLLCGTE